MFKFQSLFTFISTIENGSVVQCPPDRTDKTLLVEEKKIGFGKITSKVVRAGIVYKFPELRMQVPCPNDSVRRGFLPGLLLIDFDRY
jgi:hypothetical protein